MCVLLLLLVLVWRERAEKLRMKIEREEVTKPPTPGLGNRDLPPYEEI